MPINPPPPQFENNDIVIAKVKKWFRYEYRVCTVLKLHKTLGIEDYIYIVEDEARRECHYVKGKDLKAATPRDIAAVRLGAIKV